MKIKLIFLISLLLFFIGCTESNSESPGLEIISQSKFDNINANGEIVTINISSNSSWTITAPTWCSPSKKSGQNDSEVSFTIAPNNEQKTRTATIKIAYEQTSKSVTITQKAITITEKDMETYHYKIPVIFHVLYKDKNDANQYIKEGRVNEIIAACNKLYNNSNGKSTDINLEFYLAKEDSDGNTLPEPGIDRIQVANPTFDCDEFMKDKKNLAYTWDTDKYINIFLYKFLNDDVLGISHLPYTAKPDKLDGLYTLDFLPVHSSLTYPHCISINSTHIYEKSSDEGKYYNSLDIVAAVAHEIGHYLGLHHAFNESEDGNRDFCEDTDYCTDTPAYNRVEYEKYLTDYLNSKKIDYNDILILSERKDCNTLLVSTPNNIMDYDISFLNRFTAQQKERIRYVLTHSPLIPGPKIARSNTRIATTPQEFPMRIIK